MLNKSPFDGFSKLSYRERLDKLSLLTGLKGDDWRILSNPGESLSIEKAEHLVENVIGLFSLPLGVATHFQIDGRDVPVPMVVEETSIIAAASSAAKWVRQSGGFQTRVLGALIIGQIQFPSIEDPESFKALVEEKRDLFIELANETIPNLVARGGGVRDLHVRLLPRPDGKVMAVLHLLCDSCDAMGANLINQVCEALKSPLEECTGERIGMCILSNLVDTKMVEATCAISNITPELGRAIEEATLFANLDAYRCATHNKGVMNGIDPVVIATGNDWRAVEAGIHAYVALNGKYRSITEWKYDEGVGILRGRLAAPIAVGTVGGVTRIHPAAQLCLKIMGVEHAQDLARICATTGLAQNLAALRALCTEGIVRGHMRLHAANLAITAGALGEEVDLVGSRLREIQLITLTKAKEILAEVRAAKIVT